MVVMPISGGHVNPAVSIAAWVSKRITAADMAGYVVAQLLGAVVAGLLLRGLLPKAAFQFASGGVPGLGQDVSMLRGAGIEALLTFFLVFTFWAVCFDNRGPRSAAPFAVGLSVAVGGLAGLPFTGAAMNPARWFGPALAGGHFANWLVWVAGPLLGGLLGALAYEAIFLSDQPFYKEGDAGVDGDDDDEEEEVEPTEPVELGTVLPSAATSEDIRWRPAPAAPPVPAPAAPPVPAPAAPPVPAPAAPPVPAPAAPPVPAPAAPPVPPSYPSVPPMSRATPPAETEHLD
jgi:MIP family channel proteins